MATVPGKYGDYELLGSPTKDGSKFVGVLKGPGWINTVALGEHVHFSGDKRDFAVGNGVLIALDGPLGGSAAPAAASNSAKIEQARAALTSARVSIEAAIAALR